jgi:hypothetical protein
VNDVLLAFLNETHEFIIQLRNVAGCDLDFRPIPMRMATFLPTSPTGRSRKCGHHILSLLQSVVGAGLATFFMVDPQSEESDDLARFGA